MDGGLEFEISNVGVWKRGTECRERVVWLEGERVREGMTWCAVGALVFWRLGCCEWDEGEVCGRWIEVIDGMDGGRG